MNRSSIDTIGNKNSVGNVSFQNCLIPKEYMLGTEGAGFMIQMTQFQHERNLVSLRLVNQCERVLHITVEHLKHRKTFDNYLIANQYIQFTLASLEIKLAAAKSFVYESYRLVNDEHVDTTIRATMSKYYLNKIAREIADFALQMHGAKGYLRNSFIANFYLDSRGLAIAGGTDEMMLHILSNHIKTNKQQ